MVIKPVAPSEPAKAQIDIEGADDLYREIRIENVVTDENGQKAHLKRGAQVDIIVEQTQTLRQRYPISSPQLCLLA